MLYLYWACICHSWLYSLFFIKNGCQHFESSERLGRIRMYAAVLTHGECWLRGFLFGYFTTVGRRKSIKLSDNFSLHNGWKTSCGEL